MIVHQCDNCRKMIKNREDSLTISHGPAYNNIELCDQCSGSIKQALKEQKLLPKKLITKLEIA